MSNINLTPAIDEEVYPSIEELKGIYSRQRRDCWMCAEAMKALESGKTLKEEQLWHFTHCVLSWEQLHLDGDAAESFEHIEKAA